MAIERLQVILEMVTGNYQREAKQAATATGGISQAASGVTGALKSMIGPAAIGGAVVGLVTMAEKAGENADRLFDLAAQTGLSTDALQEWEFVAKTAGANTETFSDAVKAVVKNLSEAAGGTGAAADAYETLGIKVLDASGNLRSAGDITDEVFEKLAGMENITQRNALAQDIFGKKWEETISVLDLGSEALANMRKEGRSAVISQESLRNADKFRETWAKLQAILGPKLFEALGNIAPALTEIAEGAVDALEAFEPLIDALGFVAEKFGEANDAIDAGRESPNEWAQRWAIASDIGKGYIFGVAGALGALFDEENRVRDNTAIITGQITDSWATTGAKFKPIAGDIIGLIDRQGTAMSNAAKAANNQRTAMINLANAQADLLDPVANVLRLQEELATAQETLTELQANGETPARDLALAQIEVEQAMLRLNAAGAALSPDQIQAFAQLLITQFGQSEEQALRTLEALNLLDGWTGTASFILNMNEVVSRGGSRTTTNLPQGVFEFHEGGVVPGPRGSEQLILAHGGETVLPTHKPSWQNVTKNGPTIVVQSPTNNLAQDLQYAALLANIATLN
jgi:hypothetical protein